MLPLISRPAVGFLDSWQDHPTAPAVLTADGSLTYGDLDALVTEVEQRLGSTRRLVLLVGDNSLEALTAYLGALRGGHVAMLLPPGIDRTELLETYRPDVVGCRDEDGAWAFDERTPGTSHELHPDLALLLTTSGSTGSPKLVRLTYENLASNAEAIVEYLSLSAADRAPTALPMSYCYGLSVINSHLACGAALLLTDLSVTDPCFWELFRRHDATGLPGVPYTFRMLERIGFDEMQLPSLRYVTQAGGALGAEQVRALCRLGRRRGWQLFVMYGQTEATARMAYLPPELAEAHPAAVGRAIPGGCLDVDEDGELVYRGPNVMLGYARGPEDLARGRDVTELRTGDLARRNEAGLLEITGRRSRFVKAYGLRLDLDHLERSLREDGIEVMCSGDDEGLVVGVASPDSGVARRIASRTGLPASAVVVHQLAELPRTATGKPDYSRLRRSPVASEPRPRTVHELFAAVLEVPVVTDDDTFVRLGGDSLSYVEMSLRLEELLGALPTDWHLRPVRELAARPDARRTWGRALEPGVLLRAVAILLIVAHHSQLFRVLGGAHVLLGVAGYNFARFQLTSLPRRERLGRALHSVGRVVAPTVPVVLLGMLIWDRYGWQHLLLVHDLIAPDSGYKHFWFVEVLVQLVLVCALLLALPWADRAERRWPFATPLVLLGLAMLPRFGVVPAFDGRARLYAPYAVAWLFVWGWATARARTTKRRLVLTAVLGAALPGFFLGNELRTLVVGTGLLALLWVPRVRLPRPAVPVVGVLASASLYVYLAHFLVLPAVQGVPVVAFVLSLAVGLGYWWAVGRAEALIRHPRSLPALPALRRSRKPAPAAA